MKLLLTGCLLWLPPRTVLHMVQMAKSGRFQLFDYGSPKANVAAYGTPRPPDLAAQVSVSPGSGPGMSFGMGSGMGY